MELSRRLLTFLAGILFLALSIARAEETGTVSNADISTYVTLEDLKDPTWGDATPDPEVSDENYFEYSPENVHDSQVAVWYSLWTLLRQNDTDWNELGEWRLFANDWYNTKNFECSLSMQHCLGEKKLESLQADHPGIKNRPLVRRIYFVSRAYGTFHNYGRVVQTSFERIKANLVPMVPELINSFTQQTNQRGERLCAMVKSITEVLIAVAVSMTSQAATMAFSPTGAEGVEAMRFMTVAIKLGLSTVASIAQPAITDRKSLQGKAKKITDIQNPHTSLPGIMQRLSEHLQPITWTSNGVKFSYNWWNIIQNAPFIYYWNVVHAVNAVRTEYGALEVEGGSGDGGWGRMCASFEGDFTSRNGLNMEQLQTWIPGQFGFIRNRIEKFYKDVYEGQVPFRGGPSMMAFMLAGKAWTGNDSFLSDLRDSEKWQYEMERNFVKGVISKLLAKSYNYVTCTRDPKARSMCDAAEKYSKSSSEWDEKMTILSKSRFCPRPESDPDLVCQVEKWYFSVNQQHSRAMNGLSMIESFQGDRFKLRRNELFQEAYDNYARCGNACTNFDWHKGPFSRDMTFTGSFHLPICQNDQLNLVDFTRYWGWNAHPGMSWYGYGNGEWSSWNFPAVCGDHHASETRGFLEAMNAGMRSDVYSHHYFYRTTDQLWRDRIPRQLEALGLPPYNHFMAMCEAGVYLPGRQFVGEADGKIQRSPQQGTHYRCDDVTAATATMDEFAANKWLCVDSTIGKDIQDDSPSRSYHLTGAPRRHLKTYKQRCSAWRKKWKFEPIKVDDVDDADDMENEEEEDQKRRPSNSSTSNPTKSETYQQ